MTMAKMESEMRPGPMARVRQVTDGLGLLPLSLIQLMARVGMAVIFWRSGQAKLANWDLTLQLFANEYRVPVLPPEIAAPLAAAVELSCPVLLVLGLATRLATLPMIGMTLVIQIFVYPMSWVDHLVWSRNRDHAQVRGRNGRHCLGGCRDRFSTNRRRTQRFRSRDDPLARHRGRRHRPHRQPRGDTHVDRCSTRRDRTRRERGPTTHLVWCRTRHIRVRR